MKYILLFICAAIGFTFSAFRFLPDTQTEAIEEATLESVLLALGEVKSKHHLPELDAKLAAQGEELVKYGKLKNGLLGSKLISPYFVCTDCHSLTKEAEDGIANSPDERLTYAQKQNSAYLPASTFWGIYNRIAWYQGDYEKKYGGLIEKAKDDLRESIQVCAKYCSAGRFLEDWEVESILHYFKTLELKMNDLQLSDSERAQVNNLATLNDKEKQSLLGILQKKYVRSEGATFLKTMPREERKYGEGGNVKNGEYLYEKSCMHCHFQGRVTHLKLDKDILTARMLERNLTEYNDESIYQIVRYGTYTRAGRNQYMPLFTKEKMSDEQINDLVAYIKQLAND
ncbi:MAG: cytochrome c [Crocinitomicaceae bacterium]|jgi:mono/diheme cytochrome c family protein|nr:cytochrome c [Crocinitomicaceae bacterium]